MLQIMIILLFGQVICDINNDCQPVGPTAMECQQADIGDEIFMFRLQKLQIGLLRRFEATLSNFPQLKYIIISQSEVPCSNLLDRLPGVVIKVHGVDCQQNQATTNAKWTTGATTAATTLVTLSITSIDQPWIYVVYGVSCVVALCMFIVFAVKIRNAILKRRTRQMIDDISIQEFPMTTVHIEKLD